MFRKGKLALAAAGVLGSLAIAAPAQATGWAFMTMFYDDEMNAVGLLVQCVDGGSGGMWGIQTNNSQTQYGLSPECTGWA